VAQFEEAFAKRIGRRYGVAVSNGSAALELALAALGLAPGAEVIIPTFTIISCAAAVIRAGAIPVAVDCDPLTWNATPATVAAAITSRTKAIMIVHIYGLPVDMDGMIELAERHGLAIVEDASEGLGQSCRGRPCGSFGALSTFSFYPNKLVTTGEGGMVVTDDPATAGKLRSMRNLCHDPNRRFLHHDLGWNHRMTNLQAAVGLAQLDRLEHFTARKRRIGALYAHLLADNPYTQLPLARTSYAENLYWVFGIVLHDEAPVPPSELATMLAVRGIGTRPFFWPMHEQPVLRRMGLFSDTRCPVAERIGRRGLYLPSGLGTSDEQIERVADAVGELLG
jgi:perosamine synthetase